MNKWEAIMSSIMVQSSSGTWIPVGHLVVSEECGDTVKAGVAQLKQWCPSWKHHYCLIDDSSRERKRVESSSGGPTDLCTVHSRRTMMKRLGTQRTSIDFLNRAMHRYTQQGCIDDIDRAINRASTEKSKASVTCSESMYLTRTGGPDSIFWFGGGANRA